jgi:hypothetical protein
VIGKWTLVSDIGQFSVTGSLKEKTEICGHTLYSTDENIYVRIDEVNITSTMAGRIRQNIHPLRTTNEIGMLNYLARETEDLAYNLYKKSWIQICYLTQQKIIWIQHLANNREQAYLAARMLLRLPNIYAIPAGQFLSAYECELVEEYYLKPSEKCYKSIPIYYKQYEKEHVRYLLPSRDLALLDVELSCHIPIKQYWKSNETDINGKVYIWNGTTLNTGFIHATTIQLVQQVPNITYLHLLSTRLTDTVTESLDILTELSSSSANMMLSMAHMSNIDMVTLDSEMLMQAASTTVSTVRNTVKSVINQVYPFLAWIHKIICIAIIAIIVVFILVISLRIYNIFQERKTKSNITNFIKTLDSTQPIQ